MASSQSRFDRARVRDKFMRFVAPVIGKQSTRLLGACTDAFAGGNFNQVPILQGSNLNEGRFFEPQIIPFAAPMATIVAGRIVYRRKS